MASAKSLMPGHQRSPKAHHRSDLPREVPDLVAQDVVHADGPAVVRVVRLSDELDHLVRGRCCIRQLQATPMPLQRCAKCWDIKLAN